MTNKPNILVLGATGKVGGEVVNQLVDTEGVKVIATTRSPEKAQAFKDKGIDSVILNLDDPKTIAPALQNIDRALLLTVLKQLINSK